MGERISIDQEVQHGQPPPSDPDDQNGGDQVNEEASEKVLELEQKYNEIRKLFMSHPALSELLTDEDQKIFKYLSKLEVEDCKDVKSGYSITFHFESNPYSEDAMLTKTFTFFEEGTTEISAKAITWKEGMGIPIGVAAEEKKGNKRPKAEERLVPSIFLFYYSFFLQCLWELVEIVICSSKFSFLAGLAVYGPVPIWGG
ncbi:hypothetical protein SASPL_128344 [Salvia splendens]|uniref:Template-activating factor I n=1 Tax=Salvia splendens TaxID=180675 RepID=A0A8X8XCB4_SALSN|nr:hypothetical protein SASPL_128344 [Salvia splendens]